MAGAAWQQAASIGAGTGHWELPPSHWLNRHPQASFLPTYALEHPEEEGENTFDSLSPQL